MIEKNIYSCNCITFISVYNFTTFLGVTSPVCACIKLIKALIPRRIKSSFSLSLCVRVTAIYGSNRWTHSEWYVSHNFIDPRDKGPIMGALLYHQIAPFVWEILSSDPHILRTYSLFSLANYYKVLLTSTCT